MQIFRKFSILLTVLISVLLGGIYFIFENVMRGHEIAVGINSDRITNLSNTVSDLDKSINKISLLTQQNGMMLRFAFFNKQKEQGSSNEEIRQQVLIFVDELINEDISGFSKHIEDALISDINGMRCKFHQEQKVIAKRYSITEIVFSGTGNFYNEIQDELNVFSILPRMNEVSSMHFFSHLYSLQDQNDTENILSETIVQKIMTDELFIKLSSLGEFNCTVGCVHVREVGACSLMAWK